MPRRRAAVAATAFALVLGLAGAAGRGPLFGVEMPAAGDDGGAGFAATAAVRLALGAQRVAVRDSSRGGFLNPHRDEGSDNDVDVSAAPGIVAAFAADPRVAGVVGGLRRNVGDADAAAAETHGVPAIVLARWSRRPGGTNAFCLCASPARLVASARAAARARFGPRLLVVLVGEAGTLPPQWPEAFAGVPTALVGGAPTAGGGAADAVGAARRQAAHADAVLVLTDERPAALWRSAAFRRAFTGAYVRRLAHRDFVIDPPGTPRGDVVVLREALPDGPARRAFVRRFHAAQGFVPTDDAARAYAAAEILRAAALDAGNAARSAAANRDAVRRALRSRTFDTAAGSVRFDRDGYRDGALLSAAAP